MLRRTRIAAVTVTAMVAAFAVPAAPVSAMEMDNVTLVAPNGGAKVQGTLYWYGKRTWEFRGWLTDTACNSHSVYVAIFKNQRYAWERYEGTWTFWGGQARLKTIEHSDGCNVSRLVSFQYKDPGYNNRDVDFSVCDDGISDSCSSVVWPKEWYGAYRNPFVYLI